MSTHELLVEAIGWDILLAPFQFWITAFHVTEAERPEATYQMIKARLQKEARPLPGEHWHTEQHRQEHMCYTGAACYSQQFMNEKY